MKRKNFWSSSSGIVHLISLCFKAFLISLSRISFKNILWTEVLQIFSIEIKRTYGRKKDSNVIFLWIEELVELFNIHKNFSSSYMTRIAFPQSVNNIPFRLSFTQKTFQWKIKTEKLFSGDPFKAPLWTAPSLFWKIRP